MLRFEKIRKSYGTQAILDDVSFHIFPGEKVGLVGPNGAGKSTILKILIGEVSAEKGEVILRRKTRIGFLKQQIEPKDKELTVLEYATASDGEIHDLRLKIHELEDKLSNESCAETLKMLGNLQERLEDAGAYEIETRAKKCLSGLGFEDTDFDRALKEFSGGWQMRVELVRSICSEPELMLLDEPTNYLDLPAVEWLEGFLRSCPFTLLLISHDRYLLNSLTNVTLEVYRGEVTRYPGAYDEYIQRRAEKEVQLQKEAASVASQKQKLESFINRFKAKATKATQARSRMKMLDKLQDVEVLQAYRAGIALNIPEPPRSSPVPAELHNARFSYDGVRDIFKNITLEIEEGEHIAVVGKNGMGKTTFLKCLAGDFELSEGKRRVASNTVMGWHAQDFIDNFDPTATVFETMKNARTARTESELRSYLGSFSFGQHDIDKRIEVLSGGEKVRLSLARLLLNPPNLLFLDEPTTHLDIQTREALQDALSLFEGTICFVSHDLEFVKAVASKVLEITPDGMQLYHGDYDYYQEKKLELDLPSDEEVALKKNKKESSKNAKERRRQEAELRKKMSKEVKPIEAKIQKLESKIETCEAREAEIAAAFSNADNEEMKKLNAELQEVQSSRLNAEDDWSYQQMRLEELKEKFTHG